jgi:ABC-type xylose transport system permease subunit
LAVCGLFAVGGLLAIGGLLAVGGLLALAIGGVPVGDRWPAGDNLQYVGTSDWRCALGYSCAMLLCVGAVLSTNESAGVRRGVLAVVLCAWWKAQEGRVLAISSASIRMSQPYSSGLSLYSFQKVPREWPKN